MVALACTRFLEGDWDMSLSERGASYPLAPPSLAPRRIKSSPSGIITGWLQRRANHLGSHEGGNKIDLEAVSLSPCRMQDADAGCGIWMRDEGRRMRDVGCGCRMWMWDEG